MDSTSFAQALRHAQNMACVLEERWVVLTFSPREHAAMSEDMWRKLYQDRKPHVVVG